MTESQLNTLIHSPKAPIVQSAELKKKKNNNSLNILRHYRRVEREPNHQGIQGQGEDRTAPIQFTTKTKKR